MALPFLFLGPKLPLIISIGKQDSDPVVIKRRSNGQNGQENPRLRNARVCHRAVVVMVLKYGKDWQNMSFRNKA
jgi:hypothetical protein